MHNGRPILLIDDDDVDAMTVKRALADFGATQPMVHFANPDDALRYLRCGQNRQPSIILLDPNMPETNAVEFLKTIRTDESHKTIPVVILTSSGEDRHTVDSLELGVAGYIVKPINYDQFTEAVKNIEQHGTLSPLPVQT